ncbi:MAG: hypothetical protein HFI52_09710 [Lachnospiraceae bacterium]|nr:hypothetical protein [Lachnospiraceae bacterium]
MNIFRLAEKDRYGIIRTDDVITRPLPDSVCSCGSPGEAPETVADHYKALEHHALECIACGSCERNCPFAVGVVERMKKAAEVFGY